MPPKGKAKAKAVVPDTAMYEEVANELGIVGDYKQYRASAENLNKAEDTAALAIKAQEYAECKEQGGGEDDAVVAANAAYTRAVFKLKLQKSYNKHLKKSHAAPPPVPEPVAAPAAAVLDNVPADDDELKNMKTVQHQEAIQSAYNRIVSHRLFKNIVSEPPNPIQDSEAGDTGMQDMEPNSNLMQNRLFAKLLMSSDDYINTRAH